jgi:hypothetical protein
MGSQRAVDNLGISWRESHKKPNKMRFSCGFSSPAALGKTNLLRFSCGSSSRVPFEKVNFSKLYWFFEHP